MNNILQILGFRKKIHTHESTTQKIRNEHNTGIGKKQAKIIKEIERKHKTKNSSN